MTIPKNVLLMAGLAFGLTVSAVADDNPLEQTVQETVPIQKMMPPTDSPRLEIGKTKTFFGKLEKVDWQKSGESYCQGGAEYYVLVIKGQRYTLESLRDPKYDQDPEAFDLIQQQLAKWEGRTITLKGQEVVRYFSEQEHCPDPNMQCVTGDIVCSWIRVSKIIKRSPRTVLDSDD